MGARSIPRIAGYCFYLTLLAVSIYILYQSTTPIGGSHTISSRSSHSVRELHEWFLEKWGRVEQDDGAEELIDDKSLSETILDKFRLGLMPAIDDEVRNRQELRESIGENKGEDKNHVNEEEENNGDDMNHDNEEEENNGDDMNHDNEEEENKGEDMKHGNEEDENKGEVDNHNTEDDETIRKIGDDENEKNKKQEMESVEDIPTCPDISPHLVGKTSLDFSLTSIPKVEEELSSTHIERGGKWSPLSRQSDPCTPNGRTIVLIPYRAREQHLPRLLRHLHPFLQRQLLEYQIIIIEQSSAGRFNRGKLFNVGVAESEVESSNVTSLVLHDVDYLPLTDSNTYVCQGSTKAIHFASASSKFKYKLPYKEYFGGVTCLSSEIFHHINGFSNIYWGWGAEDDDLYRRIKFHKFKVDRLSTELGRYRMLQHEENSKHGNPLRSKFLKIAQDRYKSDGLRSLNYSLISRDYLPLYTRILVELYDPGVEAERRLFKTSSTAKTTKKVMSATSSTSSTSPTSAATRRNSSKVPPSTLVSKLVEDISSTEVELTTKS